MVNSFQLTRTTGLAWRTKRRKKFRAIRGISLSWKAKLSDGASCAEGRGAAFKLFCVFCAFSRLFLLPVFPARRAHGVFLDLEFVITEVDQEAVFFPS